MSESSLSKRAGGNDRPILSEARKKALIALVGSAVAAAVSFGAISPNLAEQINQGWAWALGAIVTVLPLLTSVLHALGIVKGAEPKTTPVDSPTDNNGEPMVPLHAAGLGTADDADDSDDPTVDDENPDDDEFEDMSADGDDLDEAIDPIVPTDTGETLVDTGRHHKQPGSAEQTGVLDPVEGSP